MRKQLTPEQQMAVYQLLQITKKQLVQALRNSGQGLPQYYSEHTKKELVTWVQEWVDPVKVYRAAELLKHNKG